MEILRREMAVLGNCRTASKMKCARKKVGILGNLNQLPPALLKRYADECRAFATTMRIVERKLHPIAGFSGSGASPFALIF